MEKVINAQTRFVLNFSCLAQIYARFYAIVVDKLGFMILWSIYVFFFGIFHLFCVIF